MTGRTDNDVYGCKDCGEWFPNIAQLHRHCDERHPGKMRTRTASPEQMKTGLAAMDDLRQAMGHSKKHS